MIPRSSVHNLQSFASQFNTGKLVTKVLKKLFSDGGHLPPLSYASGRIFESSARHTHGPSKAAAVLLLKNRCHQQINQTNRMLSVSAGP